MSANKLGELLVKEQVITPLQLKNAIESQRSSGGRLGYELTKLGYIEESDLTAFFPNNMVFPVSISMSLKLLQMFSKF